MCITKVLQNSPKREILFLNSVVCILKIFNFTLTRLGSDPEKTFPRKAFEEQLKKNGKFGVLMAILALPFITTAAENTPNLDKVFEKCEQAKGKSEKLSNNTFSCFTESSSQSGNYNQKMLGIFEDMCSLDYI